MFVLVETSCNFFAGLLGRSGSPFETIVSMMVISVSVIVFVWYYLFWKPFDFFRDFTDYGYGNRNKARAQYSTCTRRYITELQRRRKVGNIPPVYPNGWFVILASDKLGSQSFAEVNALGLNLVAWRDSSGTAYAADAYIHNLSAHIREGIRVTEECITCSIPTNPEIANIKTRSILEQNGFIYMWYHCDDENPKWFPKAFPEIESKQLVYRGTSEFRIACHIQEIFENGSDTNHFSNVHSFFSWRGIKPIWSAEWKPFEEQGKEHMAVVEEMAMQINFFDKILTPKFSARLVHVGPGLINMEFNTPFGKAVILSGVTPLGPLLQKHTHRLYTNRSLVHPIAKVLLWFADIVMTEDMPIWNRKTYLKNPFLPKEDTTIKRFRLWYSQFYSKNSPRYNFSNWNKETSSQF